MAKMKNMKIVVIEGDCPKCGESMVDDNGSFHIYIGHLMPGAKYIRECYACGEFVHVYTVPSTKKGK